MQTKEQKIYLKDIIILILCILVLILLCVILNNSMKSVTINSITHTYHCDGRIIQGPADDILADKSIIYAGYEDIIASAKTGINLSNPKENEDICMRYEIYIKDMLIYETDMIAPGGSVLFVPAEYMEKGTYAVELKEIPYYKVSNGEYIELVAPSNTINITITE